MRRVLGWLMFLALLAGAVTASRLSTSSVVKAACAGIRCIYGAR